MTGHEPCRHCRGTGWVVTSSQRNEVARCPGPDALASDVDNLRARAQTNWERYEYQRLEERSMPPDEIFSPSSDPAF